MLNELKEYRKKRQTYVTVLRKTAMYILIVLGCLFAVIPGLIFGAIFSQYIPDTERISIKIDDDRTVAGKLKHDKLVVSEGGVKTSYSALSYNVGFNAYNQDMHFFMDMGINTGNGQSWAESAEAVHKSNAGVARVLSASHDAIYSTDFNDLSIPSRDLRGSKIYKTFYENTTNPDLVTKDEPVTDIAQFNSDINTDGTGTFDFIAIQEQDVNSTRSYYVNEYEDFRSKGYSEDAAVFDPDRIVTDTFADHYNSTYAYNYSVPWIPYPLNQMHGQVQGGLSVNSKYTMEPKAERITLPNITSFPLNLFELKRCLISTRYKTNNGDKEFVFLNAHFSAYDDSGLVRLQQLGYIQKVFEQEVNKGNYVLLAADWNQVLPQTYGYSGSDTMVDGTVEYDENDPAIAPWTFSDFKWGIADPTKPTNDDCFESYDNYDSTKQYKKGDVVSYDEHEVDGYIDHVCENYGDKHNPQQHLYTPLKDNPTEAPLIEKASGGYIKSTQWRYYDDKYYLNTSLSHRVLDKLLPIAGTDPEKNHAHFFTTHAIPTVRNAGYNFRSTIPGYINQYTTSIDGFLISDNIGINFTFGIDTQFAYSDHNPAGVSFYLKK